MLVTWTWLEILQLVVENDFDNAVVEKYLSQCISIEHSLRICNRVSLY